MFTRPTRRHRMLVAPVGLFMAASALAGCSGGAAGPKVASVPDPSVSASSTPSPTGDPVKYADCLREHGVSVSDPGSGGSVVVNQGDVVPVGGGGGTGVGTSQTDFEAAVKACEKYQPTMSDLPASDTAEMRANLLALAKCMRAAGFTDFADPDFSNGAVAVSGSTVAPGDEAKWKSAMDECSKSSGLSAGQSVQVGGSSTNG